jgi:pantoate--beta-alanine ligase
MLTPEMIRVLFQYNQWADRRTLDACAALANEQFTRDLGSSFRSVRDTLAHLYGAEWVWNERISGRSPSGLPSGTVYPDLAAVRAKLEEMDSYYLDYVSKLTPSDLERVIKYKALSGDEFSNPIWQILHQLTNHASYHRGQVTTMLRQLGAKPATTDLIAYYREQAATARPDISEQSNKLETIHTIEWMKQVARQVRSEGRPTGFVPTMGALHEGHISLVREALAECRPVIASIFVNPSQFGPTEDFQKYPRTFENDRTRLEEAGIDYLFAPEAGEMYPRDFRTWVNVDGLSERLEGRVRPGHFRGVTTVVLKLLEIVQPQKAFFGRKDAQQARLIQQMARDLHLDSEIIVCPIAREPDGLALSSRNVYLNPEERRAATVLYRALDGARRSIERGELDAPRLVAAMREIIRTEPLVDVDYVELVAAETLEPMTRLRGTCLALVSARVGTTHLIDNLLIEERDGSFFATL